MKEATMTMVHAARNSTEAEEVIGRLRHAGLHPAELTFSAPLRLPGSEQTFPVEVPAEEAEAARAVLKTDGDNL